MVLWLLAGGILLGIFIMGFAGGVIFLGFVMKVCRSVRVLVLWRGILGELGRFGGVLRLVVGGIFRV